MSTYAPPQGQQQQGETEVVSGAVAAIITKGQDKWQISVNTGGQYARNLWTKDAALVNQMQNSIGQGFDFICGVSHWQGQSGPVRSLWINSVALYGSTPVQQQQVPGTGAVYNPTVPMAATGTPVPQQQPMQQAPPIQVNQEEKERRIMRQAAMKITAAMLPFMPAEERSLPGMVTVAEGLMRYFVQGPQAVAQFEGRALPPQGEQQQDGYDGNPAPPADDWGGMP